MEEEEGMKPSIYIDATVPSYYYDARGDLGFARQKL